MNSRELMDSVTRDMDFPRGGIEERIELDIQRHRKGWGRFVLSDSEGKPIQNAKLKFTQTKHEFLFGSNLFKLRDFPTKKQNDLYEKLFQKVFNIATVRSTGTHWNPNQESSATTKTFLPLSAAHRPILRWTGASKTASVQRDTGSSATTSSPPGSRKIRRS